MAATGQPGPYIPPRALKCKVYRNGEPGSGAKCMVLNRRCVRNWDVFLQNVQQSLKCDRPVQRLCTPVGGSKISGLEEIQDQGSYVALTSPRFKKMEYSEASVRPRGKMMASTQMNWDVKPVLHSKYRFCSGRIRKIPTDVLKIYVYRNGCPGERPKMVTFTHKMVRCGWDSVFNEIMYRMHDTIGAPRCLCTTEGKRLKNVEDIETNHQYVLLCSGDRKGFRKVNYGQDMMAKPLVATRQRVGAKKKEENTVFHARPIQYKRTSIRQVDYDKDEGGVFKAKQYSRETDGAEEVEETKDTKVELPIDQSVAEPVDEEDIEEAGEGEVLTDGPLTKAPSGDACEDYQSDVHFSPTQSKAPQD